MLFAAGALGASLSSLPQEVKDNMLATATMVAKIVLIVFIFGYFYLVNDLFLCRWWTIYPEMSTRVMMRPARNTNSDDSGPRNGV